jgi:hypothetical protein
VHECTIDWKIILVTVLFKACAATNIVVLKLIYIKNLIVYVKDFNDYEKELFLFMRAYVIELFCIYLPFLKRRKF